MRLILLVALTMAAFAANSLLNRLALAEHAIGPASFAAIRLGSGGLALAGLLVWRRGLVRFGGAGRAVGVASLLCYMLGFSFAYVTLQAGTGALILFGGVQITMFSAAILRREAVPARRWLGAVVAMGGLIWLLRPAAHGAPSGAGAGLMAAAAVGWGIYSLNGRRAGDPLADTGANFGLAAPVAVALALLWPDAVPVTGVGVALAVGSGVVTSGLGYALWYAVLPQLQASVASVAQLSVPVIALAGGALVLGEVPSGQMIAAAAVVLGGVVLSLWPRR